MKLVRLLAAFCVLVICAVLYLLGAEQLIAHSERSRKLDSSRTELNRLEIREHRFRPIVAIEFTSQPPAWSKSTSITVGATDIRRVEKIEWLSNSAVLVTVDSTYGSTGEYESNSIFHDFHSGLFATTMNGSMSSGQFSKVVSDWQAQKSD